MSDKIKNLKCVNYNMYIGSGTESCDNCLCFEDALEELLGFISQEIQKAVEERDKEIVEMLEEHIYDDGNIFRINQETGKYEVTKEFKAKLEKQK